MGARRSSEKMDRLKSRLYEGMACNGISGDLAVTISLRLMTFSNYGFPVRLPNRRLSGAA
jgi:error-prone DNA polymerase